MKKVLFDAKHEHDFVKNYKVLQTLLDKKQITKVWCQAAESPLPYSLHLDTRPMCDAPENVQLTSALAAQHIEVTKLCKAKPLDNLEMLQV